MSRLSCVHQTFVRSCPYFRAFTRLIVRSWSDFRAFTRLFVRSCPDFRAFFLVSRPCKFECTTSPSCIHLGLDISTFRLGPQPGFNYERQNWKDTVLVIPEIQFLQLKTCLTGFSLTFLKTFRGHIFHHIYFFSFRKIKYQELFSFS